MRQAHSARKIGRAKRRTVLNLEALEARLVPATITVNSLGDPSTDVAGQVTLRDAILAANTDTSVNGSVAGTPGSNTILFTGSAVGGMVTLLKADPAGTFGPSGLEITSTITIAGTGETITRGNSAPLFRLFYIAPIASLTLENLTLSNGLAQGGNGGGSVAAGGGAAGMGGAVFNQGTLKITASTLEGNTAQGGNGGTGSFGSGNEVGSGGGVGQNAQGSDGGGPNGGDLPATAVSGGGGGGNDNSGGGNGGFGGGGGGGNGGNGGNGGFGGGGGGGASGGAGTSLFGGGSGTDLGSVGSGGGGAGLGGALFNAGGTVNLTNDTLNGNSALGGNGGDAGAGVGTGVGGALFNLNGLVTINDSTLDGNTVAAGTTGAPSSPDGGEVYNLTFSGAGLPGAADTAPATLTLNNSILANSIGAANDLVSDGATVSGSTNLVMTSAAPNGGSVGGSVITVTSDPHLSALGNNGGPTQTMALQPGSPAIGAGVGSRVFPTDQRGVPRPTSGPVDLGAFQTQPNVVILPGGTFDVLSPTASGAVNLSGNAQLAIPGVLTVDSSSSSAITASGNASATATAINVVGGVQTSGNASLSPTPHTGAAALTDPFAGLTAPSYSGTGTAVNLGGNQSMTLSPGTYSQISVSGNAKLTLMPGTYVITTGGFQVSGNASVSMSGSGGVLLYDAGGGIAVSGNATLNLSAETSGTYAGLVIFQAPTNTRALNFSGNGVGGLSGTVYAAGAQVILSGNASLQNVSMVVNTLTLNGNAGAFQLTNGSSTDYLASTANQILVGALTVAVEDDTGDGIDPNELARIGDAMTYLNTALGSFGVNLTWAAPGTAADVTVHFGSSTPYGGASAGVLGFTTAGDDVYLVSSGWNFYTGSDPTQIGSGQYDFQTLAEHELAHAVGLGESSDPQSVMYEYLSPGTARRTFTDANLSLINTDADRFMKAGPDQGGQQQASTPTAAAGATGVNLGPATAVLPSALVPVGSAFTSLPGQLPLWGSGWPVAASSLLAAPPAVNPLSAAFPFTGQEAPGQLAGILPGSSGPDVLVGGARNGVVLGGQARDMVVGGFGHSGAVPNGDSLDAHGEAVRQVVSEWSAAGSLGLLADLRAEHFFAPSRGEEGGSGLDLVGTPLTEPDGRLPAADLFGAGLAAALVAWLRLDGAEPAADLERRRRRARTVS